MYLFVAARFKGQKYCESDWILIRNTIVWNLLDGAGRPAGAGVDRPGSRPQTATPSRAPPPST